jgi:hypothetical protein
MQQGCNGWRRAVKKYPGGADHGPGRNARPVAHGYAWGVRTGRVEWIAEGDSDGHGGQAFRAAIISSS